MYGPTYKEVKVRLCASVVSIYPINDNIRHSICKRTKTLSEGKKKGSHYKLEIDVFLRNQLHPYESSFINR